MSDYNDGLLPEPCLRMDTHFGDEYESVEFGDGTGYVKAATTLARLGALHVELDELQAENDKLRELLVDVSEEVPWSFMDTTKYFMPLRADKLRKLLCRMRELEVEVD